MGTRFRIIALVGIRHTFYRTVRTRSYRNAYIWRIALHKLCDSRFMQNYMQSRGGCLSIRSQIFPATISSPDPPCWILTSRAPSPHPPGLCLFTERQERDAQTAWGLPVAAQTSRDTCTQMPKPGIWQDRRRERVVTYSGSYQTADELMKLRTDKVGWEYRR